MKIYYHGKFLLSPQGEPHDTAQKTLPKWAENCISANKFVLFLSIALNNFQFATVVLLKQKYQNWRGFRFPRTPQTTQGSALDP